MNAYAKHLDKNNKYTNHLMKDEKILKKYLKIWNKIKSLIKNELNSEPVYNDKYIKTRIKIYNDRVDNDSAIICLVATLTWFGTSPYLDPLYLLLGTTHYLSLQCQSPATPSHCVATLHMIPNHDPDLKAGTNILFGCWWGSVEGHCSLNALY